MDELWKNAAEGIFGGVVLVLVLSLIVLGKLRLEREVTQIEAQLAEERARHDREMAVLRTNHDFWRDVALDASGVVNDSVDMVKESKHPHPRATITRRPPA